MYPDRSKRELSCVISSGVEYVPSRRKLRAAALPFVRLTFVNSADRVPQVRTPLTPESAEHKPRKRRASERHAVGRVGTPMQLLSCRSARIVRLLTASRLGQWRMCRSSQSAHPLRAQSENSLPKSCRTRERGARESRRLRCLERAPSREIAHAKRTSAYPDCAAGRRQACSRGESNVALLHYAKLKCERGRANGSDAEPRSGSTFRQRD